MASQNKKSKIQKEAEVNAKETLLFMTELNKKNLGVISDIARGVPVDDHAEYLRKIYKLRLMYNKLTEQEEQPEAS